MEKVIITLLTEEGINDGRRLMQQSELQVYENICRLPFVNGIKIPTASPGVHSRLSATNMFQATINRMRLTNFTDVL